MITRRWHVAALMMLLLVLMLMICVSPAVYGSAGRDDGCNCHNNGVGIKINGEDWGRGRGVSSIDTKVGNSFSLHVSTYNVEALDAVPKQEWMSNLDDNSKFIFSPQIVRDNSAQDLSGVNGTITALYTITVPETLQAGVYGITLFAQAMSLTIWVYVTGTPIPEFDNAALVLTFSAIVVTIGLVAMRSRRRFQ